jgi:hypothetical protein
MEPSQPLETVNPLYGQSRAMGERAVSVSDGEGLLIYDAVSSHFSVWRLFKHFTINAVPHLLIWLPISNWTAQQFWSLNPFAVTYNHIGPSLVLVSLACYALLPPADRALAGAGVLVVPLLYYVLQKLMVALKYASLSDSEYCRIMTAAGPAGALYQAQLQLLTSWLDRKNVRLMRFEVAAAAARVGTDVRDLAFRLPDPSSSASAHVQHEAWRALLGEQGEGGGSGLGLALQVQPDGTYRVSLLAFLAALLQRADQVR